MAFAFSNSWPGAVIFGWGWLAGTFLGALLGERWSRGKGGWKGAVAPALGATVVRVFAMAVKLAVALSAWLVLTVLALWP